MRIGFLTTEKICDFLPQMEKLLVRKGHELACTLYADTDADFAEALNYVAAQCQAVIFYGDRNRLFDVLKNEYSVDPALSTFELNDTLYAVMDKFSEEFINENVMHMLNSRCKIFYTTDVFRTFGKSKQHLYERLKKQIKNRSRINFSFYPIECGYEVDVRYSNKMQHAVVEEVIADVKDILSDCIYAFDDTSLPEQVVRLLLKQNKTICIGESFTGGAIASEITLCENASKTLREGTVCYTNESKIERLGVKRETIDEYGAVSVQTVYEMAVNLLHQSGCDISLATSGNAGPTSEKENDVGHCYIAIGAADGVHIFEHKFSGDRKTVTRHGVMYALYHLYEKLSGKIVSKATSDAVETQDNKE